MSAASPEWGFAVGWPNTKTATSLASLPAKRRNSLLPHFIRHGDEGVRGIDSVDGRLIRLANDVCSVVLCTDAGNVVGVTEITVALVDDVGGAELE